LRLFSRSMSRSSCFKTNHPNLISTYLSIRPRHRSQPFSSFQLMQKASATTKASNSSLKHHLTLPFLHSLLPPPLTTSQHQHPSHSTPDSNRDWSPDVWLRKPNPLLEPAIFLQHTIPLLVFQQLTTNISFRKICQITGAELL
jgi:hypothetical protein